MKLVGASWGFIRAPFLRRNVWCGIVAGLLADAVLLAGAYWLIEYEPDIVRVVTTEVMVQVAVSVLLFGVLISLLCAYLSINKYLRMKADALYYI
jgi:cell division transport system permease protein